MDLVAVWDQKHRTFGEHLCFRLAFTALKDEVSRSGFSFDIVLHEGIYALLGFVWGYALFILGDRGGISRFS